MNVVGDFERRIARLRQGDHLCLIYRSAPEQLAVLVPFFRQGLLGGERCLFVGAAESGRQLARALNAKGVDTGRELERGALVLLTEHDASQSGEPGATIDLLRQSEQQALDDGFSGLRVAADRCWAMADQAGEEGGESLVRYEALLNRFLPGSRTLAVCQCHQHQFSPAVLIELLRTHPVVMLGDQVCPNPFYESPEMLLHEGSPEDRVEWMLARLRGVRSGEEKLEELNHRLAEQGAALDRANRRKEEFLAMLAHELRNPLGTISNALQVLRLKGHGDEMWQRAIDTAERQVLHQARLVDDLLEASRVTRGQVELRCEQLDLGRLVRETVERHRPALEAAGLTVELEPSPEQLRGRGDAERLSQALENLLRNAVKFTPAGGRVTVGLKRTPEGRRGAITVRDTGIGISPEMLPQVFEVFTQADHSLDRSQGGLGVGLAVVKGLIELHGGEVEARSEGLGKGSEFTLLLPVEAPAADLTAAQAQPQEAQHPDTRRILVVEDNPDAAATMRDFLELAGHEVELALTGTEGVETARQFHPEVVLCDLGLPGMDGFEVAAELRRDPATASARLIAVTGYGGEDDRRRSKKAGFDVHLTKPVDPGQLRRAIRESRHH